MEFLEKIKNSKNMSGIIRMINNDKKLNEIVIDRTKYLDIDVSIHERLFNIKNDIFDKVICTICNKSFLEWNSKYSRYKKTCSNRLCKNDFLMINKNLEMEKLRRQKISDTKKNKSDDEKNKIIQKIKKTNLEKYGQDSYAKTDEFKENMLKNFCYVSAFELKKTHEKTKETLIERYDCDHNSKMQSVKDKKKKTFLDNYGVETPAECDYIKEKIKITNNKKYGGNSPMNNEEIIEKSKKTYQENYIDNPLNMMELTSKREETMFNKYGVKYWIQDSKNLEKLINNTKTTYKKYLFNNQEIYLQGYEDYVLFDILLKKYDISDICVFNWDIEKYTGKIYYEYNEKMHKYYPDFYIKSENKIYEVKSEYTYNSDIEINNIKREACINKGIFFEFVIPSKKNYKNWKNNKNNIKKYEKI